MVQTGATTVVGDDEGAALGCAVGGDVRPIPPVTANNATASATTKAESRNSAVERLIGQPERWCESPAVAAMVPSPARIEGGFPTPPQETTVDVYKVMPSPSAA